MGMEDVEDGGWLKADLNALALGSGVEWSLDVVSGTLSYSIYCTHTYGAVWYGVV